FGGDPGREMTARDDHRHPPADVAERQLEQNIALLVAEQELLGIVGKDADAIDALRHHAIEHPALALEVEVTVAAKRRRCDRHHASKRRCSGRHDGASPWVRMLMAPRRRTGAGGARMAVSSHDVARSLPLLARWHCAKTLIARLRRSLKGHAGRIRRQSDLATPWTCTR